MKSKARLLLILFTLISCNLKAELEFSGFIVLPKSQSFILIDKDQNQASGWLNLGESFSGYTLKSFDVKRELITLEKDGKTTELRLKESKVKEGKITVAGTVSLVKGQTIEGVRVSLIIGEETVMPLSESVRLAIKPNRNAQGNMEYSSTFLITNKEGKEESLSSPKMTTLPGQAFSLQVGDYGYEFVPQP